MHRIAIICAFLLVIMLALVGCLIIFDVMSLDSGVSNMLKFGGAIFLLGVCAALIKMMVDSKEG